MGEPATIAVSAPAGPAARVSIGTVVTANRQDFTLLGRRLPIRILAA